MTKPLDVALFYASKGWQVFPVKPGQKEPIKGFKWADEATCDSEKLKAWWKEWPDANLAIATGARSGMIVLDVDASHGGNESLMALIAEYGQLPDTVESMTGGGGRHILFAHPGIEIRNSSGKIAPGLDIRGDGGYIVAPPSIHPSGKRYEWELSCRPSNTPLAPMPGWLKDITYVEPGQAPDLSNFPRLPDGTIKAGVRNATMTSLAGTMRRRGMNPDSILAALQAENVAKCVPPLSNDEIELIAKSVGRYQPTAPPAFTDTEIAPRDMIDSETALAQFIELIGNVGKRSIKTGIRPLDEATGGLERQTLTILAARPSMGKSTLAWQIARYVARSGLKVCFFSLEMSAASLWAKAACGSVGMSWTDFRNGVATDDQFFDVVTAANEMAEGMSGRIWIDDGVCNSKSIWQAVEKYRPDLVVVDHLRLIADKNDDEIKRLGNASQNQKEIAKAFNCAVLCLAQLNRGVESRDNKRPQLSDLRASGEIEENGDLILMMYRDDYYTPKDNGGMSVTELLIRKFREGASSDKLLLGYDLKHQSFDTKNRYEARDLNDYTR